MWFSVVLPFSLLLRTLPLLLPIITVLVMPPKRATTGRTVGLGKANKKTPTPTPADDESSHDEHDDESSHDEHDDESSHDEHDDESSHEHDDGAAGSETKVHTDLNEEEAIADWLGDHPELYNKKLNAYKDKVKKDAAWLSRQPYLISQ